MLEARDRVGGRVFSLPSLVPEHAIELGAEFVHGKPKLLDEYVTIHDLPLQESTGQSYCLGESGPKACDAPTGSIFEELDKLDTASFPDEAFEATLAARFANASEREKRWARSFVQGFHAADPARISTHSINLGDHAEQNTEGDRGFHIKGATSNWSKPCLTISPQQLRFAREFK